MALPLLSSSTSGLKVMTIYGPNGEPLYVRAVGSKDLSGGDDGGHLASASHVFDEDIDAENEVLSLVGGYESVTLKAKPLAVDANGKLLTASAPTTGTIVDGSGALAAGATDEDVLAANPDRIWLFIQNTDDTEDLWVDFGADAVIDSPSIRLGPWQSYENPAHFCPTVRISVIATTTGHTFTVKEA